jgi:hypothetical protein
MLASASRRLLSSCSGVPHHAWARATRGGGSWARSACRRRAAAAGCAAAAVTAAAAAVVLPPSSRAEYRAGDPDLRDVAEHSTQAAFVDTRPVVVAISGAAGQIAYSLLPLVCSGQMFGDGRPVSLRLLDIEPSMTALRGVGKSVRLLLLLRSAAAVLLLKPFPLNMCRSDGARGCCLPAAGERVRHQQERRGFRKC